MANTAALEAEIARLRAKLEKKPATLTLKVSAKGGASLYGLGRWPVTLYKGQWSRLLEVADSIRDFLAANDHLLHAKDGE